jgi:glycosyltransferase involved in cell wall biosynthesis
MSTVSIYFFAGDFVDVLRRYNEKKVQIYQTHDEVARLINALLDAGYQLNIYSFVTSEARVEQPVLGLRVVSLGAKDYAATALLTEAVASDDADTVIAHFPNLELLRAVSAKDCRAIAVLATSYNRSGLRAFLERRRIASLLNGSRFELVSNHCLPATQHLARIGVKREKLIAWDVPHPFEPATQDAKRLVVRRPFEGVYAGSIGEGKGVRDIIHAIAILREKGLDVRMSLAGLGDIDAMKALGAKLGVSDLLSFVGLIANTEVFRMMAAADVVVVPSRTEYPEGFPLTMFEAIASRTPIVCSDHPMFRPVITNGRNASVFPAGNRQAFADAILHILTDPELYATLSTNATSTWAALKGPADWRAMIVNWVREGASSPWIQSHMLMAPQKGSENIVAS